MIKSILNIWREKWLDLRSKILILRVRIRILRVEILIFRFKYKICKTDNDKANKFDQGARNK